MIPKISGLTRSPLTGPIIYTSATLSHSQFIGTAWELELPFCMTSQEIATVANDVEKGKEKIKN